MSSRGKFIVLEGGDGSGKSSQLRKIEEILQGRKEDLGEFVFTREPGGSVYAEEIREVTLNSPNAKQASAKTAFALFWASRTDNLKNTIIPALESGKNVICDRFDSSTFAYQIFGQESTELEKDFDFFREFFVGEYKPDLYIYLDVDIEIGLKRKGNAGIEKNHFDRKGDFLKRMNEGYKKFLSKVPSVIVDANPPFEEVTDNLMTEIEKAIKHK